MIKMIEYTVGTDIKVQRTGTAESGEMVDLRDSTKPNK